MQKKAAVLTILPLVIVAGAGIGLLVARSPRQAKEPPAATASNPSSLTPAGMVPVQGGTFEMGDLYGEGAGNARPVHTVTVSSFFMARHDVTFEEYDAFSVDTGSERLSDLGWGRGRMPVINVTWFEAVSYCNWLSAREGLKPCYAISGSEVACDFGASGYRLPTEAEWEYAARERGRKVRFGNGKEIADPAGINFDAQVPTPYSVVGAYRARSTLVDSFEPNALGLFDMAGNVWQWCWDWYDAAYYARSPASDPRGPASGAERVLRGGAWHNPAEKSRAMCRGYYNSNGEVRGFRFQARAVGAVDSVGPNADGVAASVGQPPHQVSISAARSACCCRHRRRMSPWRDRSRARTGSPRPAGCPCCRARCARSGPLRGLSP